MMGALTDRAVRNLKPQAKAYQVADGEGLALEVRPSGQKAWLYRYRIYARQEKLSLGSYPDISIAKARELHGDAKKLVLSNKSPAQVKQEERRRYSDDLQTVSGLAQAYLTDHVDKLASAERGHHYIEKKILSDDRTKVHREVTPADCITIIESNGRRTCRRAQGARTAARALRIRGRSPPACPQPAAQYASGSSDPQCPRPVLSSEIRRYFQAVERLPTSEPTGSHYDVLLTLCRKGEVIKAQGM
jgi:hypothetical protein